MDLLSGKYCVLFGKIYILFILYLKGFNCLQSTTAGETTKVVSEVSNQNGRYKKKCHHAARKNQKAWYS